MGGLDARAYVENFASPGQCYDYQANVPDYSLQTCTPGSGNAAFVGDVAEIVTVDTPPPGDPLTELSLPFGPCWVQPSTNRTELNFSSLGGAGLVEALNYSGTAVAGALPSKNPVPIHAVQDYFSDVTDPWDNFGGWLSGYSDDVVVTPDSRATRSPGRTAALNRAAAFTRTASPTSCPRLSLISLNRSRSQNSSAMSRPAAWERISSASSSSWNRARFGSPVSASWPAWWRSRSSNVFCAEMSLATTVANRPVSVAETLMDVSRCSAVPSRCRPLNSSDNSTCVPPASCSPMMVCSRCRSPSCSRTHGLCPHAWAAVQPNSRSAAGLKDVRTPVSSVVMIASPALSTIARVNASRLRSCSYSSVISPPDTSIDRSRVYRSLSASV